MNTFRSLAVTMVACGFFVAPAIADQTVNGTVRDAGTLAPIPDALVSLQASGIRTTTDANGDFSLTIPTAAESIIVAAKKYYFNGSRIYPPPAPPGAGGGDFFIDLDGVPQDNDPEYGFTSPTQCSICHPDQFIQWNDSPMQKAGINSWLHDIYNGDGTPSGKGGPGGDFGFVYTRDSMFHDSNPNSECASCHQPETWINGIDEPPFTAMLTPSDGDDYNFSLEAMHGVSCDVCHKMAHVSVGDIFAGDNDINFPGIFPGKVTYTRPAGDTFLQVMYGVLGDVDFYSPIMMRASYQPQLVAEVCGACHQDRSDPEEDHTYTGPISEPTYIEWKESPYGDLDSPLYATCVDCHMPPTGATHMCEAIIPYIERDPETIRSHDVRGTTPFYLENAADLAVSASATGNVLEINVAVTNSQTGHHLPTGVTVRNMILLVEAWPEADPLLGLEPTGDQVLHDLAGVGDPAQGYYAGLPGKFFAKINEDASGNGPTFFTDAVAITADTRIPALQTDATTYTFVVPDGGGDLHVRARLIYRRAFRFLVDAKNWTQTGHGEPLADVMNTDDYGHLMEVEELVVQSCGGPDVTGDLLVGMDDVFSVIMAWGTDDPVADVDHSGIVDIDDVIAVILAWGGCF